MNQDQPKPDTASSGDKDSQMVQRSQVAHPFAHPSEAEFARILDFYGVKWVYEPKSFPIRWEGDRVVEMFTPDFYLPDLDLYVELTTLRQSLVTEKNRKVRMLRELHPKIKVKLLYKRDYHRLLARFGHGPLAQADIQGVERVLITADRIQKRVSELARQISLDYMGRQPVLIGALKGVMCFISDLMRQITLPLAVDFLSISRFSDDEGSKSVRITKDLDRDIAGQHVLVIEDIVDTGFTLHYLLNYLKMRKPLSLKVCALLDKRVRRLVEIPLDYVGFEVPDEFVVGYGLDYLERYRNLPFIGVLKPQVEEEIQTPPPPRPGKSRRSRRRRDTGKQQDKQLQSPATSSGEAF